MLKIKVTESNIARFKKKASRVCGKIYHWSSEIRYSLSRPHFPSASFMTHLYYVHLYMQLPVCRDTVFSNCNVSFSSTLDLSEKPCWKGRDRFAVHAFEMIAVFSRYSRPLMHTWSFTLVSVSPGLLNLFTALWTNCVINHLLLGTIPLSSVTKASSLQLPIPTTT